MKQQIALYRGRIKYPCLKDHFLYEIYLMLYGPRFTPECTHSFTYMIHIPSRFRRPETSQIAYTHTGLAYLTDLEKLHV